MQQDLKILKKLGYNTKNKVIYVLRDIVVEVEKALDMYEEEDVISLVNNRNSYIYIETACFMYEIGLNRLNFELNNIHDKRNIENIDKKLYDKVYNDNNNPTIEESILSIAKYKNSINQKELETNKVLKLA